MQIEYRLINKDNCEDIIKLLRSFFGEDYFGAEDGYFHWQYFKSPFRQRFVGKDNYSILAAMSGSDLLAFDAFLPWITVIQGKEALTFWDLQWINNSRTRGLGRELVSNLRTRCQVYLGYGLNALSRSSFQKLGFQVKDNIERMIAVLDSKACLYTFQASQDPSLVRFYKKHQLPNIHSNYFLIDNVEKISRDYWESAREQFACISNKGIDYLKWRFQDHPHLEYIFIGTDGNATEGLAVVRLERILPHSSYALRILEFLPTPGNEQKLCESVLAFAFKHNAILADFYCVSEMYAQQLLGDYFLSFNTHEEYSVPRLFQPLEFRKRKSINLVLDVDNTFSDLSFSNLYATKADGDQDVYVNPSYRVISL